MLDLLEGNILLHYIPKALVARHSGVVIYTHSSNLIIIFCVGVDMKLFLFARWKLVFFGQTFDKNY